jgi:predicted alpha/beta-hydrolase family hydrolase
MTDMATAGGLLLAHGAGGDADHPTFLALEDALRVPVERMRFPYKKAGRRAPDRPDVAVAALHAEAAAFAQTHRIRRNRLVLGGRSYGGRMCSLAVADGLPAAGLVLLSYPLHPPGKPDRLRTDHFAHLDVPCLFIAARNDAFGTPAEVRRAVRKIPGEVTLEWLPTGGHDPKQHTERIVEIVRTWLATLR